MSSIHGAESKLEGEFDQFLKTHSDVPWPSTSNYLARKKDKVSQVKTNIGIALNVTDKSISRLLQCQTSDIVGLNLTCKERQLNTVLVDELLTFSNLECLVLKCDLVVELPNSINRLSKLPNLRALVIKSRSLRHVSHGVYNLRSVNDLRIVGAGRYAGLVFETGIASMPNLQEFSVLGSRVRKLPSDFSAAKVKIFIGTGSGFENTIYEELPKKLCVVDLSYNPITRVPSANEFQQLSDLRELYLNRCDIKKLPTSWHWAKSLHKVAINDNGIVMVPRIIPANSGRWFLYLYNNPITKVDPACLKYIRTHNILVNNITHWIHEGVKPNY